MKLKVRTLTNTEVEIEVDANASLIEVKKKVEEALPQMCASQIMLIHQGKILIDANTLTDYPLVKDGDKLVVMLPKAKKAPESSAASTAPATPSPADPSSVPTPAPSFSSTPPAPSPPANETGATETAAIPESTLVVGPELETTINNICAMGFERAQVQRALQAAFNNPDRAVEYLMSGIPEPEQVAAADEPQQPEEAGAQPLPTTGGNLDALRQHPYFEQIRATIQTNPQVLPSILQMINSQNPEMAELIVQNQAEFLQLMSEGTEQRGGTITIQITPEQREKVQQLEALGFAEADVVEALEACEWDENAAADFLLSLPQDFDDRIN